MRQLSSVSKVMLWPMMMWSPVSSAPANSSGWMAVPQAHGGNRRCLPYSVPGVS